MADVFEGKPDGRQADTAIPVSRFRPRYRALTDDEKALHDALKDKAAEMAGLMAGTQEFILRSMASNYAGGHRWDDLDGEACTKAADEIKELKENLARSRAMHKEAFDLAIFHQERAKALLQACKSCDGEQYKFEEWAKAERYDMEEHPLHYLFMNAKTNAARMGWKAALRYVKNSISSFPETKDSIQDSRKRVQGVEHD